MREFRTHLSAIVRRVRDNGETFEITKRGKPVAILRPMKPWEKALAGYENRTYEQNLEEWKQWIDETKIQRLQGASRDNPVSEDREQRMRILDGSDAERTEETRQ